MARFLSEIAEREEQRIVAKRDVEQFAELCDGMLIAVGAGKTPRKSLRKLISTQVKIKLPVLTILTDHYVQKLNKELNAEAES